MEETDNKEGTICIFGENGTGKFESKLEKDVKELEKAFNDLEKKYDELLEKYIKLEKHREAGFKKSTFEETKRNLNNILHDTP